MPIVRPSTKSVERDSLLIKLKIVNRHGDKLDEGEAWHALVSAFENHPDLAVYQAKVFPDKSDHE